MKFAVYGDSADPTETRAAAFNPRTARAFCEGRKAFADGGSVGDNPFTEERERENEIAWGFGFRNASLGETANQTYCAV